MILSQKSTTHKNNLITCVACGDTGVNSKGTLCYSCSQNDRHPLRERVLAAVRLVFADAHAINRPPAIEDVRHAIDAGFMPPIMYAAGWRDADGNMSMFAGPNPELSTILEVRPEGFNLGRKAYIVRLIRGTGMDEPFVEPVARWNKGQWQLKKERKSNAKRTDKNKN